MTLIDLKPVRRCGECYHLIPAEMQDCPYCHGSVKFKPTENTDDISEDTGSFKMPPMSPQVKKGLLISGCGVLVILIGVMVWNFVASSMVLSKSIFEPLDEEMVISQSKDNPDFAEFYSEVSELRNYITSDEDKQRYADISYEDFLSYYNSYSSSVYCTDIRHTAEEEYEKVMLAPMHNRVDSVKNYWANYVEEHDVNKFIDIEIKTGTNMGYPIFYYIVKYPKSKLSGCSAELVYTNNWGYTDTHPQSLEDLLEHNSEEKALRFNWQDEYYWNNNEVSLTIHSVTIAESGETINATDIEQVPYSVNAYLNNDSEDNEYALIVDNIDRSFPSKNKYAINAVKENLKAKNPTIYELIERVEGVVGRPIIQRGFDLYY